MDQDVTEAFVFVIPFVLIAIGLVGLLIWHHREPDKPDPEETYTLWPVPHPDKLAALRVAAVPVEVVEVDPLVRPELAAKVNAAWEGRVINGPEDIEYIDIDEAETRLDAFMAERKPQPPWPAWEDRGELRDHRPVDRQPHGLHLVRGEWVR